MFARGWMVARLSIVAEECRCAPGRMEARGAIVTECEMRVGIPSSSFPDPVPVPDSGPVGVPVPVGVGVGGAVPIVLFSLIIHRSPIITGPSKEYILARGWTIVSAPIAIGCVPWKTTASAIVAVGWTVTGARGVEGAGARCCCGCCWWW